MTFSKLSLAAPLLAAFFSATSHLQAQVPATNQTTPIAASAPTTVPALVPYSGITEVTLGKQLSGVQTMAFLLFANEQGGEPLWTESQTVMVDSTGHFTVQLGATLPSGLPVTLFSTGESRWLEVQIAGQQPQPRVLLTSVPYAMKAADAATLGGLPASAFMLAGSTTSGSAPRAQTIGSSALSATVANMVQSAVASSSTITVTGDINLPQTMNAHVGVLSVGGVPFLHSYPYGKANAFFGGSGNFTTTGSSTTATGYSALAAQTSGYGNAAYGVSTLVDDTSGSQNTAIGSHALQTNVTGTSNTALGYDAGTSTGSLVNATAIGANAVVSQSNSVVLGNTKAGSPGVESVNVGIGTDTPRSALEASVNAPGALGPTLTLSNIKGGLGGAASIDFVTNSRLGFGITPTSRIEAVDTDPGDPTGADSLFFISNYSRDEPLPTGSPQVNMVIAADGQVTVGVFPANTTPITGPAQLNALGSENSTGNGVAGVYAKGGDGDVATYHGAAFPGDGGDFIGGYGPGGGNGATNIGQGGTGGNFTGGNSGYDGGAGGVFTGGAGGIEYDLPVSAGNGGDGIYATAGAYLGESGTGTPGYAANLQGDVTVTGTLTAATKDFKIDDPSDPSNKYLYHASVESSEMMNIYTGNVITDELGLATITLPSWFETLNTDFRYQLTVIGQFAQAIVKNEIADSRFTIMTNATHVKVSWQITAVRQDAYAKAHPLVVEQAKPANERGYYMHPELYSQPGEKQTEWGRHPALMQHLKAQRDAQQTKAVPVDSALAEPIKP